jgi:alpha/beta superfamily hydrolase
MKKSIVYFAHGKESGPWGTKISRLAEIAKKKGFGVESPDYTFTHDPDERVQKLLSLKPRAAKHLIFVGSSMGGYVSTVASAKLHADGLFLLAPAFFHLGYKKASPKPAAKKITIVHGWNDEVIPVEHSIRFAKWNKTDLFLFNGDHRLIDVLPNIERIFSAFLDQFSR